MYFCNHEEGFIGNIVELGSALRLFTRAFAKK
jgi:hypothetical protein